MRPRPIEPRAQPKIRSEGTPGPPCAVFSAFFASLGSHARNDRLRARRRCLHKDFFQHPFRTRAFFFFVSFLRTNSVEDIVATATNVSLVAGARPAVAADASAGPTPGAGGARAKLSPDGTAPDAGDGESDADPRRDPRRVRSNPTAGFAPAFASRAARKTKGKKGENTAFLETRGGGTERGLARRVQDESPFDVVARETEARGGETSFW